MTHRDIRRVLKIERQCFQQPYSREIFEEELKIKAAQVWVATYRRKIVGYIDFWRVADEIELVSIAVHPQFYRQGIARVLMEGMFKDAVLHNVRHIVLDVRINNHMAQKLYEQFGFKRVGLRKKYYSDNQEDARIMRKDF